MYGLAIAVLMLTDVVHALAMGDGTRLRRFSRTSFSLAMSAMLYYVTGMAG
jgi:hypothetical protein